MSEISAIIEALATFVEPTSSIKRGKPDIAKVKHAEAVFGVTLPDAVKALWHEFQILRIDGWELLSPLEMIDHHSAYVAARNEIGEFGDSFDVKGKVNCVWWSNGWIPWFVQEHSAICIDFDPAAGGITGQIIYVSSDGDSRWVLSGSSTRFLNKIVSLVEQRQLFIEEHGGHKELVSSDEDFVEILVAAN